MHIKPVVLEGRYVRLEPLGPEHAALAEITEGFEFLQREPFDKWFPVAQASSDPLFFAAIVDAKAVGRASILRMEPAHRVAEIGHILWGPAMRRTPASTEAVFLLCDYLFGLGARRVEWKCNNLNEASKAAAQRIGFTFEGVFRQHMIVNGESRDTAWFSLLDHEWPARREAITAWLDPANFDQGQQRRAL